MMETKVMRRQREIESRIAELERRVFEIEEYFNPKITVYALDQDGRPVKANPDGSYTLTSDAE